MLYRVVACLIALAMASLPSAAQQQAITVFAAASLKNALDDVNAAFTKNTGIKVVASYAATPALMKQVENGAPADVFASADVDWMEYGARNKLIKDDTDAHNCAATTDDVRPSGRASQDSGRVSKSSLSKGAPLL